VLRSQTFFWALRESQHLDKAANSIKELVINTEFAKYVIICVTVSVVTVHSVVMLNKLNHSLSPCLAELRSTWKSKRRNVKYEISSQSNCCVMPEHSRTGRYEYSMQSGFQHDDHQLLHVPHSRHDACKASILHRGESSQPEHIHMYTMLQYIIKLLRINCTLDYKEAGRCQIQILVNHITLTINDNAFSIILIIPQETELIWNIPAVVQSTYYCLVNNELFLLPDLTSKPACNNYSYKLLSTHIGQLYSFSVAQKINFYCYKCNCSLCNAMHRPQQQGPHSIFSTRCGPMPNVMAALPNIGGALCSTSQSSAAAYY